MDDRPISSTGLGETSARRQHRRIINVPFNPNMMEWCYGLSGTPFRIDISKTQLEVRSVLSAKLHLPICALELKEEGVAVLSVRSFHAKLKTRFTDGNETDCDCCGDGPAERIFPMVLDDAEQCRSCNWCMPLCTRCMRVNGLQQHCALCLVEEDWNTINDAEGLRRHWELMDDGGRKWCLNIVRLYGASNALGQEG